MLRIGLPCLLVLVPLARLFAQQTDDNIIIETARESYVFKEGDADHPVVIKQESDFHYLCNNYRVNIPIVEFYNDQLQLNNIEVKVNGDRMKNLKPVYDYYSSDGIFYSDARVCYFTLPFERKDSRDEVTISKTVLDPRYLTSIYFTEQYFIKRKDIEIRVPHWMKVELKEYNFAGYSISKRSRTEGDADIYTYTIENAASFEKEERSPGMSWLAPHLLVMSKTANAGGRKITYFNTLDDQYAWYRQLIKQVDNDPKLIAQKAMEITKGISGDMDKVKAIYHWVQDNIRYIAYEDGIAGFRPAKAQDVLAKKYGDCKGMANLMAELLKGIGLDGRVCWLGTNHIAYDYSTPSLGVDNHMICAWFYKGSIYYIDATETYIGFNEIAERIQGRQVLIEDGEKYLLKRIPAANPAQNINFEKRTLVIEGSNLRGKVVQTWKGENKEWLLTQLHAMKKDKQEESLKQFLAEGNPDYQISNMKIFNLGDYNSDLKIEYDLLFKNAVTIIGNDKYLDIDNRKDFAQMTFDTAKRKFPYQFRFKTHIIFETEIDLPPNTRVSELPSNLKIDEPLYGITGEYKLDTNRLIYQREIQLKNTLLSHDRLPEWNKNIGRLNEFYNNQITLSN